MSLCLLSSYVSCNRTSEALHITCPTGVLYEQCLRTSVHLYSSTVQPRRPLDKSCAALALLLKCSLVFCQITVTIMYAYRCYWLIRSSVLYCSFTWIVCYALQALSVLRVCTYKQTWDTITVAQIYIDVCNRLEVSSRGFTRSSYTHTSSAIAAVCASVRYVPQWLYNSQVAESIVAYTYCITNTL